MRAREIHLLGFPRKHALTARHFRDIVLSSLADQDMLAYEASSKKWKNIDAIPEALIPVLADTKYPNAFLIDGSRVMEEDADLGGYDLLDVGTAFFDTGVSPPKLLHDAGSFKFMLGAAFTDVMLGDLLPDLLRPKTTAGHYTIRTGINAASYVLFQAYDTAMRNVMKLINGQVQMDAINEITADAGVTVDGVLLKDGVLEDSAYPNALLLDGSRAMNEKIQLNDIWIKRASSSAFILLRSDLATRASLYVNSLSILSYLETSSLKLSDDPAWIKGKQAVNSVVNFQGYDDGISDYVTCASLVSSTDFESDEYFSISRAGDITVLASKVLNFGDNPILHTPTHHFAHITLEQGLTDEYIRSIPAGVFDQDLRFTKLAFSVNTAPGAGKSVSLSLSNGTDTMTVTLSNAETSGVNTEDTFDLDVSAEDLTLTYSQDAGGSATKGTFVWVHHHITNV